MQVYKTATFDKREHRNQESRIEGDAEAKRLDYLKTVLQKKLATQPADTARQAA